MRFSFFATYIAVWVLALLQGLLILALLRQLAELRRLVEQRSMHDHDDHHDEARLPIDSLAPEFTGIDISSGMEVGIHSLSAHGGVILFLSPECSMCKGLADELRRPAINDLPPIIVLCQGGKQPCAYFMDRLGGEVLLLVERVEEVAARYHVSGFPTAIVVDSRQKIRGYGHPEKIEDLRRTVERSLGPNMANADAEPTPQLAVIGSNVSQ
jgi:hypothetical protein